MPKLHPGRRADRWLPGVKPEGWLACEEGQKRALDLITDGCEPPCGCQELNSGPLEEQAMLLTFEPFLQPPKLTFTCGFLWENNQADHTDICSSHSGRLTSSPSLPVKPGIPHAASVPSAHQTYSVAQEPFLRGLLPSSPAPPATASGPPEKNQLLLWSAIAIWLICSLTTDCPQS
ncbi:hypothetical protein LEMLEM_LOCUS8734 [Lemmus lemmus]